MLDTRLGQILAQPPEWLALDADPHADRRYRGRYLPVDGAPCALGSLLGQGDEAFVFELINLRSGDRPNVVKICRHPPGSAKYQTWAVPTRAEINPYSSLPNVELHPAQLVEVPGGLVKVQPYLSPNPQDDPSLVYWAAPVWEMEGDGDLEGALELAQALIRQHGPRPDLLEAQGRVLGFLERWDEARHVLELALEAYNRLRIYARFRTAVLLAAAYSAIYAETPGEGAGLSLQLDDGTVLTQTFFADAESAAQDDTLQDRATYLLLEVLADEPYFIPALVLLAGMLLDSPGTVPFVSDLIQAIELIDPGSPEAEQVREVLSSWYGQADLVPPDEETEDWDEEEQGSSRVPDDIAARLAEFDAAYRPEPTRGQLAHARYQSAISHLARDDPATAEHAAREAVDLDPEVADYRLILAEALDRQGNEAEAFFVLQQAASDLPDEASVYEGLGNFHMAPAHPDYESARLAYLRALRTEPEAPWRVELGLGQACRELGRRDEAIRWLRSAYRDGPLEPPVVLGLVYALADLDRGASQAEFEEAAEIITTAVEQRSDSAELWVCLAQLQARAGQIALAIDSLRQATQLNPHHPFAADFLRELEDWYAG